MTRLISKGTSSFSPTMVYSLQYYRIHFISIKNGKYKLKIIFHYFSAKNIVILIRSANDNFMLMSTIECVNCGKYELLDGKYARCPTIYNDILSGENIDQV